MKTEPHILVAGIGNIFLGDDGFGCAVAQRLAARPLPTQVRLVDFGIRGLDLTYALLDGYDLAILIDAVPRGGAPGTLYLIEPELQEPATAQPILFDAHSLNPMRILEMARGLGGALKQILLVGCEPATFGPAEGQMGLSVPVQAAVAEAVQLIEALITDSLNGQLQALLQTRSNKENEDALFLA